MLRNFKQIKVNYINDGTYDLTYRDQKEEYWISVL